MSRFNIPINPHSVSSKNSARGYNFMLQKGLMTALEEEIEKRGDNRSDIVGIAPEEGIGFGSGVEDFIVWTNNWVYITGSDSHGKLIFSVPRNPIHSSETFMRQYKFN